MDVVNVGLDMHDLEPMTWECESFWEKINEHNLYEPLDHYLCEFYGGQASLGEINDFLRYEGNTILKHLGLSDEEIDD